MLDSSYAINFTYDGINKRDPESEIEKSTVRSTGKIYCNAAKTGRSRLSTGFFIDIGQGEETGLILSSGHALKDINDGEANKNCRFVPFGVENTIENSVPLTETEAGNLVQENSRDFIKNDWGLTKLELSSPVKTIPITSKTYAELMAFLQAGKGKIKLYGGILTLCRGTPVFRWQINARSGNRLLELYLGLVIRCIPIAMPQGLALVGL